MSQSKDLYLDQASPVNASEGVRTNVVVQASLTDTPIFCASHVSGTTIEVFFAIRIEAHLISHVALETLFALGATLAFSNLFLKNPDKTLILKLKVTYIVDRDAMTT